MAISSMYKGMSQDPETSPFSGLKSFLSGNPEKFTQLPTQTPEQQQFLSQMFSQLGLTGPTGQNYNQAQGYLSTLMGGPQGGSQAYEQFASPYRTQFQQQTLPSISERFAGMGGGLGGATSGSGFAQALGGAGAQHESNLASLFANLQRGAAGQSMGQYNTLAGMGLGVSPFENLYQPQTGGLIGGMGPGIGKGIGEAGTLMALMKLLPMLMG